MLKSFKFTYIFLFIFLMIFQIEIENKFFLVNERLLEAATSNKNSKLDKELRDAVRKGDVAKIRKAIAEGANVDTAFNFTAFNYMSHVKPTVLMYAAAKGNLKIINLLLQAGANPTLKDNKNKTVLHYAASSGNLDVVKYFLQNSALEDNSYLDKAIVILVARENNISLLERIQNLQQYLNSATEFGFTPLMIAASKGNIDAVRVFVDLGSDLEVVNNDGNTALNVATRSYRQYASVKVLLERGANPRSQNKEGNSPLHSAAANRNSNIVKVLLKNNADPLMRNNRGQTPLIHASDYTNAITHSSPAIAKLLLQNNMETLKFRDNEGNTALDLALKTRNFHMSNFLRRLDANLQQLQKAFSLAVEYNDNYYNRDPRQSETVGVIKEYLASGIDLNAVDEYGWTALMRAVSTAQSYKVALLLENGADPNIIDPEGTTALNLVGRYSPSEIQEETWSEIFLLLVKYGVNLKNIDREKEYTALNNAIEYGRDNLALLMIKKGTDVNTVVDRETALDIAAKKGKIKIVEELLSKGAEGDRALVYLLENKHYEVAKLFADRGIVDYEAIATIISNDNYELLKYFVERTDAATLVGERTTTPLIFAVLKDNNDMVELLLENEADPNVGGEITDPGGSVGQWRFTALMFALDKNNSEIVRLLLTSGADPNIKIYRHKFPLQTAIENNRPDLVKMLLENAANTEFKYGNERRTSLMLAAFNGQLKIIDYLLDHNADIDYVNQIYYPSHTARNFEGTALMWAIAGKQEEAAKLLIARGANIEKSLSLSIEKNRQDIYDKILELGKNNKKSLVKSIN